MTETPTQEAVAGGTVQTVSTTIAPWQWGQQNVAPPATGGMRSDQTTWAASATLWFSNTDQNGTNRVDRLSALKAGDTIRLENGTNWQTYTVTATAVANTGYYTVSVSPTDGSGTTASNNQQITVTLSVNVTITVALGHMAIDLTLQPSITVDMASDLMEYFCDYMKTVPHLVNHIQVAADIDGTMIADGEDVLPASVGDVVVAPPPS